MKNVILLFICFLVLTEIESLSKELKTQELYSKSGFIENKGQIKYTDGKTADDILFLYSGNGIKIYIKKNSFSYELFTQNDGEKNTVVSRKQKFDAPDFVNIKEKQSFKSHRVDVSFANANINSRVIAEDSFDEYYNFYNTDGDGILNVRKFKKITIKDLYPGIDVIFYSDNKPSLSSRNELAFTKGSFKYDFIVHPEANVETLKLIYEGAEDLKLKENGEIIIKTSLSSLKENIPLAYYINNYENCKRNSLQKETELITCNYELGYKLTDQGKSYELGFAVKNKINDKVLVIDPELFWGTYYGGDQYDYFTGVAVDSRDNIYAIGYTQSTSQIATTGAHQTTYNDNNDCVLAKFNNQGRMVWATYYGGSEPDYPYGVLVTSDDDAIFAGVTSSTASIATAGSYQSSYGGGPADGFMIKFNPSGVRQWGSYYGGSEIDLIYGIAMDSSKNFIIAGRTQSQNAIASSNGFQNYKESNVDGFVVKFDSSMVRVWGTYFGGPEPSGQEAVTAVAADRIGNVMITGYTPCTYSITNDKGHQESYGGGNYDAFVAKFYPNGQLHWSSYYGGSDEDFGRAIATYGNGNIYLLGNTKSYNNISTNGAHQQTFAGVRDLFLVKFDTYGERKWGTYYGGSGDDYGIAVSKYGFDEVMVLGWTLSTGAIATAGEVQTAIAGKEDIFAFRMNTSGVRKWGTYYGGTDTEVFDWGGISYDKKGNVIIASTTQSGSGISTPATNPHQATFAGGELWGQNKDTGEWILYGYRNDAFLIMIGTRIALNNFDNEYCQGSTISIPYTIGLDFETNNTFTLQLSDKNGSFSSPSDIGTANAYSSGFIKGTIPVNVEAGTGYRLRIVASNPANTSDNNGFNVTINALPKPEIAGAGVVCSRNIYIYQAGTSGGYDYEWKLTNGDFIGDSTGGVINVKWRDYNQGKVKLTQTNQSTGCMDSTERTIEIVVSPQPLITGELSVTSYSTENYSTTSQSILDYDWVVTSGTIEGLKNTNRITVKWGGPGVGTVRLKLTDTRTDCSDTLLVNVTINSSPLLILGKKKACRLSTERYSVLTPPMSKNQWVVTGGQLLGSNQDSVVNILWSNGAEGFIQLIQSDTVSSEIDTVVLRVELIPAPEVNFIGIDEFCEGMEAVYIAENTNGRTNNWIVYNGEIIGSDTGDTVKVKWNNVDKDEDSIFVKGSITLIQTDNTTGCSNRRTKPTSLSKNPSVEFIGNVVVCTGRVEIYTIKDKKTLTNKWTVTGGEIIGSAEDTTIQVEWGQTSKGTIKLYQMAMTNCSDSSETEITINPVPEKPIISPSGKDLISSADEGNQWFFNGEVIETGVNKILTPDKTGYYTLQVTNIEGCKSDISKPYYFEISKVSERTITEIGIKVYPNPTNNFINIELPDELSAEYTVKLSNAVGVLYYLKEKSSLKNIKINTGDFPSGIYILEIDLIGKIYIEKTVINK